ncbi:MAG: hypothetical protein ACM32O_05960 [Clostridia bacterium]
MGADQLRPKDLAHDAFFPEIPTQLSAKETAVGGKGRNRIGLWDTYPGVMKKA